jgi:hypothetical protein
MMDDQVLLILTLKAPDPRVFFFLCIPPLLVGLGLLIFAAYLTFKDPQEMKRGAWLRRISDNDWVQGAAAGMFLTSLSLAGIISSVGNPEREVYGVEAGIRLALIIIGLLSFVVFFVAKFFAKMSEK